MSRRKGHSAGFTLIELLVVILIIGILVSLLIPAVYSVLRKGQRAAIAFDINKIESAVEAYKNKYSDYPPDFQDVNVLPNNFTMQDFAQTVAYRHIRKAFPRVTATEISYLAGFLDDNRLQAPEAIVFWLGGLSSNPTQPFTGTGGPLQNVGTQQSPIWVMRTQERNSPIFAFPEARLFRRVDSNNNVVGESYLAKGTGAPFVYFDSRTYHFVYNGEPRYAFCSWVVPDDPASTSIALPYKSDILNNSFGSGQNDSILLDNQVYFESRNTFQILSAGLDGLYGPIVNSNSPILRYQDNNNNLVPLFTRFPSGKGYHPTVWVTNASGNANPSLVGYFKGQEDNLTSFSEGRSLQDAAQQ